MNPIKRDFYLNQLINKQQNSLIKIITGVRRCGKSFLLFTLFKNYLVSQGHDEEHIIAIALDDFKNRKYLNPEALYDYVVSKIIDDKPYYILLDEIQLVNGFEGVLNGFLHIKNVDTYVTGSNSKFLSSDIITEFRGRGDEIRVYPLSFSEFYSAIGGDKQEALYQYFLYGGMPLTLSMQSHVEKTNYLNGLFRSVYMQDIIARYNLRATDEMFELLEILSSNIGCLTNPQRLENTFKSEKSLKLTKQTITTLLRYFEESFLIEKAMRYDVKGRRYIGTPQKYYFADMGIRNAVIGFRQTEETHIMENVIYNELKIKGFSVDVGDVEIFEKENNKTLRKHLEVDFVANRGGNRYYIQSAFSIDSSEKELQEKKSLRNIDDSFKKIIIVKAPVVPTYDENGFLVIGLLDFLFLNSKHF